MLPPSMTELRDDGQLKKTEGRREKGWGEGRLRDRTHEAVLSDFPLWSILACSSGSLQQGNFIHGILIKYFKAGEGKEEL